MNWQLLNPFERLIFIIGYCAIFGGGWLAIVVAAGKIKKEYRARRKAKESQPISMTMYRKIKEERRISK